MELIILILIAGVAGYFLAGSRFRKPIDQTADKLADTSRETADKVEGWFSKTFRRKGSRTEQVIEGTAVDSPVSEPVAVADPAPVAEKQPSRRYVSETDTGAQTE